MKKRTVILLLLQVVVLLLLVAAAAFKAIEITPSSHPVLYKELEHIANTFAQQNVKDFNVKYRLEEILIQYPNSPEVLQLYASILLQEDVEIDKSIAIYEQVLKLTENKPAIVVFCNYVEALRKSAQHQKAHEVGQYVMNNYKFNRGDDSVDSLFINLGLIENKLGNFDLMETYFRSAIDVNPKNKQAWKLLVEMYVRMQNYVEAEKVARFALTYVTNDAPLYYFLGVSLHFQKQVDEALVQYKIAEALDPEYLAVKSNIAAAYQGLGNAYEAISYYERIIPLMPDDAGLMNNYGALLGTMHRKEEEVYWLTRALEVDPYLEQALINLAGFYQDEGLLDDARHYLKRVHGLVAAPGLVELREALMMSPLCISFEQMTFERKRMRENMLKLLSNEIKRPEKLVSLDTSMDRIQFYIPYHALNDRHLQESIGKVYPYFTFDVNMVMPVLEKSTTQRLLRYEDKSRLQISNLFVSKKRIGFMSKFFGIFEPHGMLLDGIMKYLPRNQFVVICMAIARTDGKPIAPTIFESCDEVHEISLIFQHAMDRIMRLNLDVLLFADLVSEPMNHFLSFSKLAPIQVAFWGNPITSGSPMMDYFLSADIMEHPYRTRLVPHNEPYSEQVLLTEGQGIWYFRPVDPAIELRKANMTGMVGNVIHYRRSDFNLSDDWFIYLLPQSTFKIHPLYDHVLEEILIQNPTAHLVVTGGRRPLWTALYQERLSSIFGPELMKRFHVIERVSSENFYEFLKLGDAVLHPFPFDGSRTSADALIVEKPYVTLPTEYLRGRMGFAFLRNMNIPELVARDIPDYIQIASRLAKDKLFYQTVVGKIRQNVDLIWEDMQVPYDATRFFQRLLDFPVSSYESFLKSTGRNVAQDLQRTQIRERNALAFDTAFGKQTWPLDEEGKLVMEAYIDGAERWPRIFEYWKRYQAPHRNWKAHPSFENITNAAARGFDPSQYIDKVSSARQRKAESHQLEQDQIAAASRDKSPAIARAPKLVEENHKPRLARLRELLREQNFEEAFPVAVELFPFYKDDPYFLTEVGALQYYRGEYLEAFSMCQTAAALFAANNKAQESIESNACMGVSGSYLPEKGREAVDALLTAYNLNIAWQEDRERLGLPVLRNHSFFVVTLDSIESNLISALDSSQRFDDCVAVTEQIYDVAARTLFGTYVIVFSVVKWSLANRDVIDEIERNLMLDPTVRLSRRSNTASLWDQIRYLQGRATDAINHIIPCYVRSPSYSPIYNQATEELFETLSRIDTRRAQQQGKMVSAYVAPKRGVVLITQYFDATTKLQQEEINVKIDVEKVKIMQEDMNFVLTKNLMNPYIEDIFMLTEQFVNFTSFPNSNKIKQYVLGNRLTFRDAFLFSNQYIADRVVVLANADIYFDSSLSRLFAPSTGEVLLPENMILAMLKWTENKDFISLPLRTDSQDIWIYRTPFGGYGGYPGPQAREGINEEYNLNAFFEAGCNFALGLARCDNRIAYLFSETNMAKTLNLRMANVPFHIHGIEVQRTERIGTMYHTKAAVMGDGSPLLLADQLPF